MRFLSTGLYLFRIVNYKFSDNINFADTEKMGLVFNQVIWDFSIYSTSLLVQAWTQLDHVSDGDIGVFLHCT